MGKNANTNLRVSVSQAMAFLRENSHQSLNKMWFKNKLQGPLNNLFFWKSFKRKLLNFFSNFFFYLKVQSFRLIIQMVASAGHAVAYTIGRKTSSVASAVWHVAPSCWNQMLAISSSSIFVNKNKFNIAQ